MGSLVTRPNHSDTQRLVLLSLVAQPAEAHDSNSCKCRFESDQGYVCIPVVNIVILEFALRARA